jgi:hypothetical protein
MADVSNIPMRTETTAAVNRYILGDASPSTSGVVTISYDLNGGTSTYDFQCRAPGATTWVATNAYQADSTTPATSGTTTKTWRIDATGVQVALNVSAVTGSPRFTWIGTVG